MRANHWSLSAVSKFLLSFLLFFFISQIHGRALPNRQSNIAARDEAHIPPALNSSNPFGERNRNQPVWNSSTAPGDKERIPPVWNSTNAPGEAGPWHQVAARHEHPVPPSLNSSNPSGGLGRHHPGWNSSLVPGDKGRIPPVWNSTTVSGEGGPWHHAEDRQHIPPPSNTSNPFGDKGRHHHGWNSSLVPGDRDRVPPARNSSNLPGAGGPWGHAGSGSGLGHHRAAGPGPLVPDNTTTLEKRAINICCLSVSIPSWCVGCGDDSSPEPEPAPLDPRDANNYPSMAEITQLLVAKRDGPEGWAGKTPIFYSGLSGAGTITKCLQWCSCHKDYSPDIPGRVYYNTAIDQTAFTMYSTRFSGDDQYNNLLPKLFSQAYAEASQGDIYFFTPSDSEPGDGLDPSIDKSKAVTWIGWEYPALTRNAAVTHIYRVDPREGQDNDRKLMWSQGDPPSAQEPYGFISDAVFNL